MVENYELFTSSNHFVQNYSEILHSISQLLSFFYKTNHNHFFCRTTKHPSLSSNYFTSFAHIFYSYPPIVTALKCPHGIIIKSEPKSQMSEGTLPPIISLLSRFTDSICSKEDIHSRISILSQIKTYILQNPNNYHHDLYGNVAFFNVYEFIIECLSNQHHPSVLNFMLHVLALMAKFWVTSVANLRELYDGILEMFQQRMYCGENCFRFLCVLVETMQGNEDNSDKSEDGEISSKANVKQSENSSIVVIRKSIENYFVYHLLNELLAFANVFLERAVVRNEELITNENKKEENSRSRMSQSFNHSRTSQSISDSEHSQEEECELYLIQQPEPILLAILSLIRACLSYDFSHTTRNNQESDYEQQKSPIILPTKYSKYCKFSEYDILLKNENTTEMFNYLFLVCTSGELKIEILRILKIMSRIHFRYFKNKSVHKTHLENIGYVIANLLTGLDFSEESISMSMSNNVVKNKTKTNKKNKINIVLELSEIVCLLLYHQPTFYLVDISLITMLVEHVETFILHELLDKHNFESAIEEIDNEGDCFEQTKICREDLILLIEGFMGNLHQLKDYCKVYLSDSQALSEKINEMYIKIGEQYFKMLNLETQNNEINNIINLSQETHLFNVSKNETLYTINADANESNSFATDNMNNSKCENLIDKKEVTEENEETQTNILHGHFGKNIQQSFNKENNEKLEFTESKISKNEQHSNSITKHFKTLSNIIKSKLFNIGLIKSLILDGVKPNRISNILSIFKTYCPKHNAIGFEKEERFGLKGESNQNERILNRENLSIENESKIPNITEWVTSWLCNFEHYFFITSGHCRHSEEWEKELKFELLKELIEDLNTLLLISINEIINLLYAEVKQLNFILIFLFDKIGNECRIPSQEYSEKIGLDLCVIFEWILESTHKLKQEGNDEEGEFADVIEMIGGWNLAKASTDPNHPKITHTQSQIEKLIGRLSTFVPSPPHQSLISSSFSKKVLSVLLSNSNNIKITSKELSSTINEKEVSQIIWVLLKMYVNYQSQTLTQEEQQNSQISRQLKTIFSSAHHSILEKVLTFLSYELKCSSYTKSVQLLQVFKLIEPSISIESIQYNNLLSIQNELNEQQASLNLKTVELLYANSILCLTIDLEIHRKYVPAESKLSTYLNLLEEAIEFAYLTPMTQTPPTILLYAFPMLLEAQLHPDCPETLVHLAHKLINYTKTQKEIIFSLPIEIATQLLQDYLSAFQIVISSNNMSKIVLSQTEGEELELEILDNCIFIFEILIQLGSTYGCRHNKIMNIEESLFEFVVPYQNSKFTTSNNRANLITMLESCLDNNQICSCEKAKQIISFNKNLIIKSILSYLSAQAIETTFIQNESQEPIPIMLSTPDSINNEQTNQPNSQIISNQPPYKPETNTLIRKEVLKIDNLISIFELYYKIIEYIIIQFPSLFNDETEIQPIVKEGMKMIPIKGVGWVVRKLEEWENSGVTLGNEEIEDDLQKEQQQKEELQNNYDTICEEATQSKNSQVKTQSIENSLNEQIEEQNMLMSSKETEWRETNETWQYEKTEER